jgi:uncharacterized membrane protein
MLPEPLHPAIVHFPIVFVVLLPIVALVALVLIRRGAHAGRAWSVVVLAALALALSSWVAVETGEAQEEVVESVVAERAIHQHEEAGELFLIASLATLLALALGLVPGRTGSWARHVGVLAAFGALGAGVNVGHTGGELVYVHGAAQAYASAAGDRQMQYRDEDEREDDSGRDRH